MSVREMTMYEVVCDKCGIRTGDLSHDYVSWVDADQAKDDWTGSDGLITDDGQAYCRDCWPADPEMTE